VCPSPRYHIEQGGLKYVPKHHCLASHAGLHSVAGTWACEYDSALRSKGVDYKIDYIAVGRAWTLLDDPWLLAVDIRHF